MPTSRAATTPPGRAPPSPAATRSSPSSARRRAPPSLVVSLAGLARAAGEGELALRLTASRGGCLSARVALRVRPAQPAALDAAYLALDPVEPARLLRWIDAAAAALVRHGRWRGAVRALVETRAARIEGPVRVHEVGVDGARWALARAALTRGDVTAVTLWDPCAPERGVHRGGPRRARRRGERVGRGRRAEAARGVVAGRRGRHARHAPGGGGALRRARRAARRHELGSAPAGVRALPCDAAWLGRFARAPGEFTYCRGAGLRGR